VTTIATGFGFAAGLAVGNGNIYALDGFAGAGDGNKIWVFSPIPEPGTALLLGAGLLGLAGWERRFKSSRA
jgi:hypothetical protein